MAYSLVNLPYDYDALEPYIDSRTMKIHHSNHHARYVRRLNKLFKGRGGPSRYQLEAIIADPTGLDDDACRRLRESGGGHLNHSLFWQVISPRGGRPPTGAILEAINASFGDFDRFRDQFAAEALSRVGSGWVWLVCEPDHRQLRIFGTANEDSPIMLGYRPILGLDVWEHAYYLQYQNRRTDYVAAWWNVVYWERVAELYGHCADVVAGAT